MIEILRTDKEIVDSEREKYKLKRPMDFDKSRITPEDITKLIPLLQTPFAATAIVRRERGDFISMGVPLPLQLIRLFEVFGVDHIKFETKVVDTEIVKKENKNDMYYYKVYIKLRIGNWTIYNENNTKPCSTFVSYYDVDGVGYGGNTSKGTAEKNAIANGKKDCLKNMGVLAYLHIENDYSGQGDLDNEDDETFSITPTYPKTKIILKEKPIITESTKIFLKCKATDSITENEVEIIIYRENPQMKEEHQKMIDTLSQYKNSLVAGKELSVEYKEGNVSRPQYIIRKLFFNK